MKKSMLLFPFTKEVISIVRHRDLLKEYKEIYCVCLPADAREDRDISYFDNGIPVNCICMKNFETCIDRADDIYITTDTENDYVKSEYKKLIELCFSKKKNIGFLYRICEKERQRMQNLCRKHNIEMLSFVGDKFSLENKYLEKINVPVIFICGSARDTDKFETQLIVRKGLKKAGYRVSQIGTKYYSELFGFHPIPEYLYGCGMTETEKIICFNNQVKAIEREEKPDVIIIGIPGGMIREFESGLMELTIPAYEISLAVNPDYTIMNLYENECETEYLTDTITALNGRYEFEINQIIVSNVWLDYAKTKETGEKEILRIPYQEVMKGIENNYVDNIPVGSIYEDYDDIVMNIIKNLTGNTEDIN